MISQELLQSFANCWHSSHVSRGSPLAMKVSDAEVSKVLFLVYLSASISSIRSWAGPSPPSKSLKMVVCTFLWRYQVSRLEGGIWNKGRPAEYNGNILGMNHMIGWSIRIPIPSLIFTTWLSTWRDFPSKNDLIVKNHMGKSRKKQNPSLYLLQPPNETRVRFIGPTHFEVPSWGYLDSKS